MKPIAVFVVVAALAVCTLAAGAKTITSSQGNANDRAVAGVAGPTPAANASHKVPDTMSANKKAKARTRTARLQQPTQVPAGD